MKLQFETRLDLVGLSSEHRLQRVLASAFKSRGGLETNPLSCEDEGVFWGPEFFGLDKVTKFRHASGETQKSILRDCSRSLLEEAYFIERCGMYYASKMSLLADNVQERMFYSLMAAEEAVHFRGVSGYLSEVNPESFRDSVFLVWLDQMLETQEKPILVFVIQVLLEGWGLYHYRDLSKYCLNESLSMVTESIVKDEARHHGSGLLISQDRVLTPQQRLSLITLLKEFLEMVRTGPQSVASQLRRHLGSMSYEENLKVFEELQCETETNAKLDILKSLVSSVAHGQNLIDELEPQNCFVPMAADQCAEIAAA